MLFFQYFPLNCDRLSPFVAAHLDLTQRRSEFHKDIDYSEPVEFLVPAPPENEIRQFLIDKALDI